MINGLIINECGTKYWYKDNFLHNENGPALEFTDGTKFWYIDGNLHRLDGPAEEYSNGIKCWYYEGQYIKCSSQEEFEKIIKLKVLL